MRAKGNGFLVVFLRIWSRTQCNFSAVRMFFLYAISLRSATHLLWCNFFALYDTFAVQSLCIVRYLFFCAISLLCATSLLWRNPFAVCDVVAVTLSICGVRCQSPCREWYFAVMPMFCHYGASGMITRFFVGCGVFVAYRKNSWKILGNHHAEKGMKKSRPERRDFVWLFTRK